MIGNGDVGETAFLFETPPKKILPTIDSASTAFALDIVVLVLGLDFFTTDIAPNCITNNVTSIYTIEALV